MQNTHEEEFNGYTIYIEASADRWNPGFVWTICKDNVEQDTSLAFTKTSAIEEAKSAIKHLTCVATK